MPQFSGRSGHLLELLRAEQLFEPKRQVFDPIYLGCRAVFEEKVAVRRLLTGNRIKNEQRLSHRQRFRTGQSARLGDNQISYGHQLVHVRCETENAGWVPIITARQIPAQLLIAPGNHDGLKTPLNPVQCRKDSGDRPHSESAAQHEQNRQVIAQSIIFSHRARVGKAREFRRNGNAGHHHVFRFRSARHQTRFGFLRRHAIQVHRLLHPKRVRLEVGHHANRHRIEPLSFQMGQDFNGQVMRADDHVRLERLQMLHELFVGPLGEPSPETRHFPQQRRVVRLLEHHAP